MNNDIKIHDMPGGVIYIENAFPRAKEFLDAIENLDDDKDIHQVVPKWSNWLDGYPVLLDPDDMTKWEYHYPDYRHAHKGLHKSFDWDFSINERNNIWPRIDVDKDYSIAHSKAYDLVQMIEPDYIKVLKIWSEKTGNAVPHRITRNYCLRKYKVGGDMGTHVDKNDLDPRNTMDWTLLVYLNENYEGGEIYFDKYDYSIKPKAGSAVIFPCLISHGVKRVLSGNKYYIFLFMHTGTGITTALKESYQELESKIVKSNLANI